MQGAANRHASDKQAALQHCIQCRVGLSKWWAASAVNILRHPPFAKRLITNATVGSFPACGGQTLSAQPVSNEEFAALVQFWNAAS
jgi:hypothetical protein